MARSPGRAPWFSRALLVLVVVARVARADDGALAKARAAVQASDYLSARPILATALALGTNGADELAEIYRLSGIVAAALGEAQPATEAFERLLALQPKATLPAGTSPKIGRPFAAAVAFGKTHDPILVKSETAEEPPTVTVVIASDPMAMIAKARAWVVVDGKPEQVLDGAGTTRIAIELPRGRRLDVRIAALDARGNRVVELGSKDVPIVILGKVAESHVAVVTPQPPPPPTGKPAQPVATAGSRSILLSPWLYGALAGASLGASALFVIGAHGAASDLDAIGKDTQHHTQSEAVAVESRGRRDALLANLGLAATGAFAITAAILYATRPHDHVEILPVPVRGGAAVTLEVPF